MTPLEEKMIAQHILIESANDWDYPDQHRLSLVVGNQSFRFEYEAEDEASAKWMAGQMALALRNLILANRENSCQ